MKDPRKDRCLCSARVCAKCFVCEAVRRAWQLVYKVCSTRRTKKAAATRACGHTHTETVFSQRHGPLLSGSGALASFVGKNFDTRQDACWGQLRNEAVCSPSRHTLDR